MSIRGWIGAIVLVTAAPVLATHSGAPIQYGSISGHIVDEAGKSVAGVTVGALQPGRSVPGRRQLDFVSRATSDVGGDFRIDSLAPGDYFIAASFSALGEADLSKPASTTPSVRRGVAPTFYPGTAVGSMAQAVTVLDGRDTGGIDLALLSVPLVEVSGTVLDSKGDPASGVVLLLDPVRDDGALFSGLRLGTLQAGGRFTLSDVPPGEYRIDVESQSLFSDIAQSGRTPASRKTADEFASVGVNVDQTSITGLTIQMGPGPQITGRVVIDDGRLPSSFGRTSVQVSPLASGSALSGSLQSSVAGIEPDGTFMVTATPGPRLVRPTGLSSGLWLKAIRAYGADVTDDGVEVGPSGISDLEILLTRTPSKVIGRVTDDRGLDLKTYEVGIFASDGRRWTKPLNRWVVSATPAEDGQFEVTGLPAGDYLAVARKVLDKGEWFAPANLERWRAIATPFVVRDGVTTALNLVRGRG